jgi:hypothetical protein|tara:strand:- start:112 stop:372 length:261 start_codon:yes stop_codon:yes gene_type:complete
LKVTKSIGPRPRGVHVDVEHENQVAESGIQSRPVWALNNLNKPYSNCQNYELENALFLIDNTLLLPSGVGLNDLQIKVITTLLYNY